MRRALSVVAGLFLVAGPGAAGSAVPGLYAGSDGIAEATAEWFGPCLGPGTLVVTLLFVDGRTEVRSIAATSEVVPQLYCNLLIECAYGWVHPYLRSFHDAEGRLDLDGAADYCIPGVGSLAGTLDGALFAMQAPWMH